MPPHRLHRPTHRRRLPAPASPHLPRPSTPSNPYASPRQLAAVRTPTQRRPRHVLTVSGERAACQAQAPGNVQQLPLALDSAPWPRPRPPRPPSSRTSRTSWVGGPTGAWSSGGSNPRATRGQCVWWLGRATWQRTKHVPPPFPQGPSPHGVAPPLAHACSACTDAHAVHADALCLVCTVRSL